MTKTFNKLNSTIMTSQEKLFLISWLSDDLEIENKNPTLNHSTINLIKTIIMKLKGGK